MKDSTPIYSDFKTFLTQNDNKIEFFLLITDKVPNFTQNISTSVTCTKLSEVTSNSKNHLSPLFPCNHKEADTRIIVHLSHAAQNGIERALIKTVDTVVVIALAHFLDLEIHELQVEFWAVQKKRWLPMHVYAQHLGKQKCLALLFWYAFTACDYASKFNGRGEKSAWNMWEEFPDITNVFSRLSLGSADIADDDLTLIERFAVLLSVRIGSTASVNGGNCWLFRKKDRSVDNCPPTFECAIATRILFYFTKQ